MKNTTIQKVSLFLFVIFLCSCEAPIVNIESLFTDYVDRFEEEAAARGINIDFSEEGIEILLVDSTTYLYAGYCDKDQTTHQITIQRNFWDNVTERDRERLLFHELGHCILNRSHKNGLTDDREFLSIMQGSGSQSQFFSVRNRFINYSGFRKDYYLDELFDGNTSRPFWADTRLAYADLDSMDKDNLFFEDFDNNDNEWYVDSTDQHQGKIENGLYTFTSKSNSFFPSRQLSIDPARNFQIEIRIKASRLGAFLLFGSNENSSSQFFSFQDNYGFANGQYLTDGNNYGYIFRADPEISPYLHQYVLKPLRAFDIKEFVLMTIRREGDRLYYFLNEEFFYVNDYYPFSGDRIAFLPFDGEGSREITIDYFSVDYIP
ncbi:MAG: hypothetical protein R8P61_04440 [Bacteroidia bacterium]|nr:hypothetical protein [Bacteroidia bacterium]